MSNINETNEEIKYVFSCIECNEEYDATEKSCPECARKTINNEAIPELNRFWVESGEICTDLSGIESFSIYKKNQIKFNKKDKSVLSFAFETPEKAKEYYNWLKKTLKVHSLS